MKFTIEHDDDSDSILIRVPANGFGEETIVRIAKDHVRVDYDKSLIELVAVPREKTEKSTFLIPSKLKKVFKL